jgi:polysaccharide export outer membrane protein
LAFVSHATGCTGGFAWRQAIGWYIEESLEGEEFPMNSAVRGLCEAALTIGLCVGVTAAGQKTPPAASPAAPESAPVSAEYRIGAGDVLEINVWNEPQASVQGVVVRPDGKVSLPLIKEIEVLGQTPLELQKALTARFEKLIRGADVTVVVKEIRSKKVYLVGAMGKAGPIPLVSDHMTVLQALAEAGGLSQYAKRGKIYVLRNENGKQVRLPFDYNAVIKGEHMEQNVNLLPDDTIVVP